MSDDRELKTGSEPVTERPSLGVVTTGLKTKSSKIIALTAAGYLRTEIAALLNIRYQHVRNVLESAGLRTGLHEARSTQRRVQVNPAAVSSVTKTHSEYYPASDLIKAGFVKIGHWTVSDSGGFALDCIAPVEAGVYVFVVDGTIRYIGLTQRGIRNRMMQYVRGHVRQRTSARVKTLITEALASGCSIEVLVASPEAMTWNGLPVLTAPGLEAGLIKLIRPAWNMQGVG